MAGRVHFSSVGSDVTDVTDVTDETDVNFGSVGLDAAGAPLRVM